MRPQPPKPEQFAIQARTARSQGDLTAAARHLGRALLADPHRREWLALLSELMEQVDDPLALVPLRSGGLSVGEIAIRAYALFKSQRYHDAVDHLLHAALAAPHSPLLDWGLAWLKKSETATSLNTLKLANRLKAIHEQIPKLKATPDGGAPLLVRIAPLVRRLRETQVCDAAFLFTAVELLRQVPDLREAYETAREAHELEPSYHSCLALGGVYCDREDWDRAARWYQQALEISAR